MVEDPEGDPLPDLTPLRHEGGATFSLFGTQVPAPALAPGLHVVATPIGNLADVTLRALQVLAAADVVLAEDTRVSRVLLAHFGIGTRLLPYHEHNAAAMRPQALRRLAEGAALALISDAGTPLVSDPGYKLVVEAVAAGHPVHPVPGASAILAALVGAGLPSDRFYFEGFLPPKTGARRQRLAELASIPATIILFESPRRLPEMLADVALLHPERPTVVARELTKRFEEFVRGTAADLAKRFAEQGPPRGEIVVLLGPPEAAAAPAGEDLDRRILAELERHTVKDAVAVVCAATGLPRREVYGRAVALAAGRDAPRR